MTLLLDPGEFRMLDGLRLNPRRTFAGRIRGERLTRKKGISIEFADYREYTEGDDLRHLDWNVLARLDTPVMRTYQDEEDLAVYTLVDLSPSMEFGEPTKLDAAKRFASTLAYVALNSGDAVIPIPIGRREAPHRPLRGRVGYPHFARWADRLQPANPPADSLAASLRGFANSKARTGVTVIVSDGMDPDIAGAIRILGARGHEVLFLQVLSSVELDPDLEGDLRLVDAEGGNPVEVTANSAVLKEYRRRLLEHNGTLADTVRRVGGRYAQVTPEEPVGSLVQNVLRRGEWVV